MRLSRSFFVAMLLAASCQSADDTSSPSDPDGTERAVSLSAACNDCLCSFTTQCCYGGSGYICSYLQGSVCANQCSCTPSCSGKTCGSDGCGGTCGTCG